MRYIKSSGGYYYKEYSNGKRVRISEDDYNNKRTKIEKKNIKSHINKSKIDPNINNKIVQDGSGGIRGIPGRGTKSNKPNEIIYLGDLIDSSCKSSDENPCDDNENIGRFSFNLSNIAFFNKNKNFTLYLGNRDLNKIKLLRLLELNNIDNLFLSKDINDLIHYAKVEDHNENNYKDNTKNFIKKLEDISFGEKNKNFLFKKKYLDRKNWGYLKPLWNKNNPDNKDKFINRWEVNTEINSYRDYFDSIFGSDPGKGTMSADLLLHTIYNEVKLIANKENIFSEKKISQDIQNYISLINKLEKDNSTIDKGLQILIKEGKSHEGGVFTIKNIISTPKNKEKQNTPTENKINDFINNINTNISSNSNSNNILQLLNIDGGTDVSDKDAQVPLQLEAQEAQAELDTSQQKKQVALEALQQKEQGSLQSQETSFDIKKTIYNEKKDIINELKAIFVLFIFHLIMIDPDNISNNSYEPYEKFINKYSLVKLLKKDNVKFFECKENNNNNIYCFSHGGIGSEILNDTAIEELTKIDLPLPQDEEEEKGSGAEGEAEQGEGAEGSGAEGGAEQGEEGAGAEEEEFSKLYSDGVFSINGEEKNINRYLINLNENDNSIIYNTTKINDILKAKLNELLEIGYVDESKETSESPSKDQLINLFLFLTAGKNNYGNITNNYIKKLNFEDDIALKSDKHSIIQITGHIPIGIATQFSIEKKNETNDIYNTFISLDRYNNVENLSDFNKIYNNYNSINLLNIKKGEFKINLEIDIKEEIKKTCKVNNFPENIKINNILNFNLNQVEINSFKKEENDLILLSDLEGLNIEDYIKIDKKISEEVNSKTIDFSTIIDKIQEFKEIHKNISGINGTYISKNVDNDNNHKINYFSSYTTGRPDFEKKFEIITEDMINNNVGERLEEKQDKLAKNKEELLDKKLQLENREKILKSNQNNYMDALTKYKENTEEKSQKIAELKEEKKKLVEDETKFETELKNTQRKLSKTLGNWRRTDLVLEKTKGELINIESKLKDAYQLINYMIPIEEGYHKNITPTTAKKLIKNHEGFIESITASIPSIRVPNIFKSSIKNIKEVVVSDNIYSNYSKLNKKITDIYINNAKSKRLYQYIYNNIIKESKDNIKNKIIKEPEYLKIKENLKNIIEFKLILSDNYYNFNELLIYLDFYDNMFRTFSNINDSIKKINEGIDDNFKININFENILKTLTDKIGEIGKIGETDNKNKILNKIYELIKNYNNNLISTLDNEQLNKFEITVTNLIKLINNNNRFSEITNLEGEITVKDSDNKNININEAIIKKKNFNSELTKEQTGGNLVNTTQQDTEGQHGRSHVNPSFTASLTAKKRSTFGNNDDLIRKYQSSTEKFQSSTHLNFQQDPSSVLRQEVSNTSEIDKVLLANYFANMIRLISQELKTNLFSSVTENTGISTSAKELTDMELNNDKGSNQLTVLTNSFEQKFINNNKKLDILKKQIDGTEQNIEKTVKLIESQSEKSEKSEESDEFENLIKLVNTLQTTITELKEKNEKKFQEIKKILNTKLLNDKNFKDIISNLGKTINDHNKQDIDRIEQIKKNIEENKNINKIINKEIKKTNKKINEINKKINKQIETFNSQIQHYKDLISFGDIKINEYQYEIKRIKEYQQNNQELINQTNKRIQSEIDKLQQSIKKTEDDIELKKTEIKAKDEILKDINEVKKYINENVENIQLEILNKTDENFLKYDIEYYQTINNYNITEYLKENKEIIKTTIGNLLKKILNLYNNNNELYENNKNDIMEISKNIKKYIENLKGYSNKLRNIKDQKEKHNNDYSKIMKNNKYINQLVDKNQFRKSIKDEKEDKISRQKYRLTFYDRTDTFNIKTNLEKIDFLNNSIIVDSQNIENNNKKLKEINEKIKNLKLFNVIINSFEEKTNKLSDNIERISSIESIDEITKELETFNNTTTQNIITDDLKNINKYFFNTNNANQQNSYEIKSSIFDDNKVTRKNFELVKTFLFNYKNVYNEITLNIYQLINNTKDQKLTTLNIFNKIKEGIEKFNLFRDVEEYKSKISNNLSLDKKLRINLVKSLKTDFKNINIDESIDQIDYNIELIDSINRIIDNIMIIFNNQKEIEEKIEKYSFNNNKDIYDKYKKLISDQIFDSNDKKKNGKKSDKKLDDEKLDQYIIKLSKELSKSKENDNIIQDMNHISNDIRLLINNNNMLLGDVNNIYKVKISNLKLKENRILFRQKTKRNREKNKKQREDSKLLDKFIDSLKSDNKTADYKEEINNNIEFLNKALENINKLSKRFLESDKLKNIKEDSLDKYLKNVQEAVVFEKQLEKQLPPSRQSSSLSTIYNVTAINPLSYDIALRDLVSRDLQKRTIIADQIANQYLLNQGGGNKKTVNKQHNKQQKQIMIHNKQPKIIHKFKNKEQFYNYMENKNNTNNNNKVSICTLSLIVLSLVSFLR